MPIRKLIRDIVYPSIAAGVTSTTNVTIPDDCVDIEVQIIAPVAATLGTTDKHSVTLRDGSSELLSIAEWEDAGSYYATYPPVPGATIVRFTVDNGDAASVTGFRAIATFHVKVKDLT